MQAHRTDTLTDRTDNQLSQLYTTDTLAHKHTTTA